MGYGNGNLKDLLFIGTICLIAGLTKAGNNEEIFFQCQSGWKNINYTCYKPINTKVAWDIARDYCKSLTSELVRIPDYWVNKEIATEVVQNGLSEYWIGFSLLEVSQSSGNAQWSNGEQSDTKHGYWSYFNPNSKYGKCSYETNINNDPKWALGNCNAEKAFVCEKPACTKDTFMCRNSRCIGANQKCDGKDDCQDGTDEENCPNLCRFYQAGTSGSFKSENFPQNYKPNSFCVWKIQSDIGTSINLIFSDFLTEANVDFVEIYVDSLSESNAFLKYRLSGNTIAQKSYMSTNNMMMVKFTSDSSIQLKGFDAKWTTIPSNLQSSEMNAYPSGNLTVSNFVNDEQKTFIIRSVTRRDIITLEKLHMELFDEDEVIVFNGDSLDSPVLATYKGPYAESMGPRFIQSTGEAIMVLLKSRGLFSGGGFTFSYYQGCKITVNDQLSGVMMTPGFGLGENYPNSLNCEWNIDIPTSQTYSIKFDSNYGIDNPDDILYVYNIVNSKSTLLFNSTASSGTPPTSIDIASGAVKVTFQSNAIINEKGFKAVYSVDCPDPAFNAYTEMTPSNSKWTYMSKFSVSCKNGYGFYFEEFATDSSTNDAFESKTPIEMVCSEDGKWNVQTIPQCTLNYCGPVKSIQNGRILNATGVRVGDVAYYACLDSYAITGKDNISCQENGKWEALPVCSATGCSIRSNIANGVMKITEGTGNSVGSIASYTCNPGYEIDGEPISQCNQSGQWSYAPPSCQILQCSVVCLDEKISNAKFTPSTDVDFGTNVAVSCNSGYVLNGTSPITCSADQSFGKLPQCEDIDECKSPPNSNQCTQICVNTVGSYYCECEKGFQMEADKVTCTDIDECATNKGNCEQVCKNIPGSYECECNNGFALYTSDNTMNFSIPTGESGKSYGNVFYLNHSCVPVQCPEIGNLANGNIQPQRKFSHYGDTFYFSCNIGFELTGKKSAVCLANKAWSTSLPTCTAITCAAPDGNPALPYMGLYNFTCEVPGKPKEYRQRQCLYDPITDSYKLLGDSYDCEEIDCGQPKRIPGALPYSITKTTYGSKYEVNCSDLYKYQGNTSYGNMIYCNNDGKWEYGDIKCDGVLCDFPPVPVEGIVNVTTFTEDSTAIYSCMKEGYVPKDITERKCVKKSDNSGLEWDQSTPKCVDMQPPMIKSGSCNASITLDKYSKLNLTPPDFVDNSGHFTVEIEPKEAIKGHILTANMTIVYTATDAAGYSLSCHKKIIIEDRPFQVTCPSDIQEELEASNSTKTFVFKDSDVTVISSDPSYSINFTPKELNVTANDIDEIKSVTVEVSVGTKKTSCTFYVFVKAKSCSALSAPSVQHAVWSSVESIDEFTCKTNYSFPMKTKMAVGCISSWNTTYTSCSKLETLTKVYGDTTITYSANEQISDDCAQNMLSTFMNKFKNIKNYNPCAGITGVPIPKPDADFTFSKNGSKQITFSGLMVAKADERLLTSTENVCFDQFRQALQSTSFSLKKAIETLETSSCPTLTYQDYTLQTSTKCSNQSQKVTIGTSDTYDIFCVPCPPGSYYDLSSGVVTCKLCPIGEYQDNEDQPSCKKCPLNTSTYSTGGYSSTMCKPKCPAGFVSPTGIPPCDPCPANTYSVNTTYCQTCPTDTKGRETAAKTIDVCKAQCNSGTFSFDGYEPCNPCPKAFYADQKAQTGCLECDVNTTTSTTGANSKTLCLSVKQVLCTPNPCTNGQCVTEDHLFKCVCSPGFTGELCDKPVDPCLPNPCYYEGNCSKDGSGYKCNCPAGTNGTQCENIIEKCKADTCKNNGICQNIINDVKCYCMPGYGSTFCEQVSLPCENNPCRNGMCKNIGTERYKCDCTPGYEGDNCDIFIEKCASAPCLFNATCTNLVNDFSCNCPRGYSGKTCNSRENFCSGISCNVGTCVQNLMQGTYTCSCDEGYTYGQYCQLSMKTNNGAATGFYKQSTTNDTSAYCIDECLKDTNCTSVAYNDADKSCSFYTGQTDACCQVFTKECQNPTDNFWTPWYPIKGSVEPSKVLEMLNDVGLNVCKGHVTSLTQCKTEETEDNKMRPDKYDVSLDLSNPCKVTDLNCVNGNENECSMYRIRFQCAVSKVMQDNKCEMKSACHDIHCGNGSMCIPFTKTCACASQFEPPFCRVPKNFCSGKSCGNGTCINGDNGASCKCNSGFEGPDCTNINDCKSNPCNATGTKASGCEDLINDYYCPCKAGFKGKNCEENIDECRCKPCLHKGVCKDGVADFTCECPDGWTGKRCEKIKESCMIDSCVNNGVCLNLFKTKYCRCQPNTYGSDCSDSVSICKDANPCINDVTCTESGGKSTCTCKKGFTGVGCEIVVDFCKSEVCANGGKCINEKDGFKCECKKGFEGLQCEQDTNDCTTSMNTCVEPKANVCPLGKTGLTCTKDVSNNYDMEFYLNEKNGMAILKSPVFVPKPSFSISLWVQFKEKNGVGTFFNLFMIKPDGIKEKKIPVLRLSDVGITYAPASGGPEVTVKTASVAMNDGKWHLFTMSVSDSGSTIELRLDNFQNFEKVTESIVNFFDQKCVVILGCFYDPATDMATLNKGLYGTLSQVNIYNKSLNFQTEFDTLVSNPMANIGDVLAGWGSYILMNGVRKIAFSSKTNPGDVQTFIDVKSCPKMVNNYGSQGRTLLSWTPPEFTDYSQLKMNYRPDTAMLWGDYEVTYEAKDEKGNVALCNFRVYAKEKNCTKPDDPYEGTAVCTDEQFPYYSCNITCNAGKALTKPAPLLFTCGPTGWWHPNEYYLPMRFPTCGDVKTTVIHITLHLEYSITSTDCQTVENQMKPKLIETMQNLNKENSYTLCALSDCSDIVWNFTCNRQANAGQDLQVDAAITPLSSSASDILTNAVLDENRFDYGDFVAGGNQVDNQFYLQTTQSCNGSGEALLQGRCVECTPGTYLYNSTQCEFCPVGTYQENVAQTSCVSCPENTTTLTTGHMKFDDCKKKCPPGEFFDMQKNDCEKCDVISYQDLEGQFYCKPCLDGKSTQMKGATSAANCTETCQAGYEFTTNCTACQIGYYREANTANTCVKCSNNKITPGTGSISESQCTITACFAGTYLDEASNTCMQCEVGKYQDESNQKTCKACPSVNYRTDGTGSKAASDCYFFCESGFQANNNVCESCPKGTYRNNSESSKGNCKPCPSTKTTLTINSTSDTDCKIHKCPPGKEPNAAQDDCKLCPLGTYQPKEGEPKCIQCDPNYSTASTGSIEASSCDAFCESGYEKDSGQASGCKKCEIGYFKDNSMGLFTTCQLCSNGKITEQEASISEQNCTKANCSAGQYLKPTLNACFECDYGFYQDEKWMTSCKPCPNNYTTYMKGADKDTLCLPSCMPGYGVINKQCTPCPIGYFHDGSDPAQESCSICPDPKYVTETEGAISVANCTVMNCTAGTYLYPLNNTCLPCPMDTYQDVSFQQTCKPCESGFKTWEIGSVTCVRTCPAGEEYKNNVCTKCEIGYYRTTDTQLCMICPNNFLTQEVGAKDQSFCTIPPCLPGTFSDGSICKSCPKNTYQDKRYQSTCTKCPGGYYTKNEGTKIVSECFSYCTTNAHNCSVNSTCKDDETNGFTCDCNVNFIKTGTECLHMCDINYCLNGGTCIRAKISSCLCDKYFTGTQCDQKLSAKELSSDNTNVIIGAVVGVLAAILIIILIVTYICVHMRNSNSKLESENTSYPGSLTTKFAPMYLPTQPLPQSPYDDQVTSFINVAYDEDNDPAIFKA